MVEQMAAGGPIGGEGAAMEGLIETAYEGMPLTPVEALIEEHTVLIGRIRAQLAMDPTLDARLLLPVIRRGAAYFHRLPASQSHHHFEPGGLLTHSLEVALMTLQLGEKHLHDAASLPSVRKRRELGWRFALFAAGWLHDAGKIINGIRVWEPSEGRHWNPYRESLIAWATRLGASHYRFSWRAGRGTRHARLNPLLMRPLLGAEAIGFLVDQGADLIEALSDALLGLQDETELYPYLAKADSTSAGLDFRSMSRHRLRGPGFALDQQLVSAMRQLFADWRWRINQPRSLLWHLNDALYLLWPDAGLAILREPHVTDAFGVSEDPDALLDLLLEFGIAAYQPGPDGEALRYAKHQPKGLDQALNLMKLSSKAILFEGEIPLSLRIEEALKVPSAHCSKGDGEAGQSETSARLPSDPPDDPGLKAQMHLVEKKPPSAPPRFDAWIGQHPNPEVLREWVHRLSSSRQPLTVLADGRGFLPHPEAAKRLGYAPMEVLKLLSDAGWIMTDPLMPQKRVMSHQGVRGIFLHPEAARGIRSAGGPDGG